MTRVPPIVLAYGLLGLVPFLAPPVLGWSLPEQAPLARSVLVAYGALILSFLGGARWAFAVRRDAPDPPTVSLSMLPSIAGLALLLMPGAASLPGLAAALALQWAWDVRSPGLPAWYAALRSLLTVGAVAGLLLGAAVLP